MAAPYETQNDGSEPCCRYKLLFCSLSGNLFALSGFYHVLYEVSWSYFRIRLCFCCAWYVPSQYRFAQAVVFLFIKFILVVWIDLWRQLNFSSNSQSQSWLKIICFCIHVMCLNSNVFRWFCDVITFLDFVCHKIWICLDQFSCVLIISFWMMHWSETCRFTHLKEWKFNLIWGPSQFSFCLENFCIFECNVADSISAVFLSISCANDLSNLHLDSHAAHLKRRLQMR